MPDSSDEEGETAEKDIKADSDSDELSDSEMKKGWFLTLMTFHQKICVNYF